MRINDLCMGCIMTGHGITIWEGESGQKYMYHVHRLSEIHHDIPANYIVAKEVKSGTFVPIYIAQTENIGTCLESHSRRDCINMGGATHILSHEGSPNLGARQAEEVDLGFL
jgi:hypothetical protein